MNNIFVRTGIAAATALTISTTAMAMPASQAVAMQTQMQDQLHFVGHKHSKKAKRAKQGRQWLYPHQVVRKLERRGFRNVRRVYFSDGKYYARAKGHHGPVKLVVSAKTGQILSRQRIYRPHRHGWNRQDWDRYHHYGRSYNGFSWSFTLGR